MMKKLPGRRFHLVFSVLMAAVMVFIVTFFVTLVNIGWTANFVERWMRAFAVAYCIAAPTMYFLAPAVRRLAARFAEIP